MPKDAKNKENKKVKTGKEKKHFLRDTKAELRKVIWPNSKQLINNTVAVISVVLIVGVIVFILDVCFQKVNEFGVERVKSVVQTTNQEEDAEATEEAENEEEVTVEGEEENSEPSENNENAE